ncbi:amino acid ABC transporter substrate-binding protein [Mangrovactinospora gilvigrisea]|uniref:Amino acid ABC transporter substrate-binding protein n=1 Tax=Mangrovactinospora gilvigrisea TaxID=1428644 RepID=A0A1J7BFG4_9ACTN|nr:ABC transporter substrate-binding protein [Mangrovactinospora gilvigrisea]OIV37447.1 amino acid ABC transporter substrate-binding protein [Mangrovactinospora gilvigrisea]
MTLSRRTVIASAAIAPLALAGCASSDTASTGSTITVGFLASQTGIYQPVGEDMINGFRLYLALHGNRLGGHRVHLVVGDEGLGPDKAVPATTTMVKKDRISLLAGGVGGGTVTAVQDLTRQAQIPFLAANAGPDKPKLEYLWQTSYLSTDPGTALAPQVLKDVRGPVYAVGPDYQGGWDELRGFTAEFAKIGGKLANPGGKTLFIDMKVTDFTPYFARIQASGAKAVYAFFAGGAAIAFVKQYRQSPLAHLPLYGPGFLTEGTPTLNAEGSAALGVTTSLNYSADLDTAANRAFVAAWSARHPGTLPTTYAMASYDAAAVADRAIAAATKDGNVPTPQQINTAIGGLGQLPSPRGTWQFNKTTHAPAQPWYLRTVVKDGNSLANRQVKNLATLGG